MHLRAVRNRPSLPAALLLCLLAVPAGAQRDRDRSFEESSQVVAVEVPVNVVGRDGNPVRGLTAEDFEVYDGGERQTITSFEVVDLISIRQEREANPGKTLELPSSSRRHFLLLFDLSFSSPTSVLKARLAARDFVLNSLQPTDLAAVATYSLEHGPKLVVTFTPDRAQLARAVDTLGMRRVHDARADPLRFLLESPGGLGDQSSGVGQNDLVLSTDIEVTEYLRAISNYAERVERTFEVGRISSYSRALGDMARALNAVKGRKHIVLFSEGFDSRLLIGRDTTEGEDQRDQIAVQFGTQWTVDNDARFGNTGLQNDLHKMLEEFRRADCVIQSVDIGGLRAGADQRPRASGQEALFYMANETGGELFKDANNLREPLERVLDRTSVTYVLSFERSDLKSDGAYRRLKVKVKGLPASARVSHRAGYYAPRPFKDLDPLEKNLLASDGIAAAVPRRDLDINVLVAPFRNTETQAYVPVIVEVGGPSLLVGHKGDKMEVELFGYVSDAQNQMRGFFTQKVEMAKARKALEQTGLKYYGHFDLAPGNYRVRVLVRNAITGRTAVESLPLEVPSYQMAQPVLLPPFFIEEDQRWIKVRERTGDSPQAFVDYPFTVSGEPYVPSARPVLRRDKAARLCLVAYNLGEGDLELEGRVISADGKDSPAGGLAMVERTATGISGLDKLIATFDPAGLKAGEYVLHVNIKDPKTGHRETNSLSFDVIH
ncbi:MAG TPA: VWA domain-containing protein [Thermoanaerobaculia bacterium]|nr:VWA domain-containing protein [Thermoanaerobaculia bacterium]